MKKSISRTLAQIDVAANISVRIHEDFFNTHPCSQQLSGNTQDSDCVFVRRDKHSDIGYRLQGSTEGAWPAPSMLICTQRWRDEPFGSITTKTDNGFHPSLPENSTSYEPLGISRNSNFPCESVVSEATVDCLFRFSLKLRESSDHTSGLFRT
jgi:hypothetical protein